MSFNRFDWYHPRMIKRVYNYNPIQKCIVALICLGAIPTWLLTRIAIPWLPEEHAWYGSKFSLREWKKGQTNLCLIFDYIIWVYGIVLLIMVYKLV